ncbi:MAG: VOC family protein [Hyphomicrobiales bacterium]|nr:VOC family protein [Hyphomicrobiales bacterium]
MKSAFTHCALHVGDIDASIAFYERFCGLKVVHAHGATPAERTVWMAEEGREKAFVMVLVSGGRGQSRRDGDMTHYGFAVERRADVDTIAAKARAAGCLYWEPQQLPYPVGYLCALEDPDGYIVEFSHGQPLGPAVEPH